MRTKALIGAAVLAAGLATSMAQVYSLNVVGYVNVVVPTGFSLVANPLAASPDNTINTLWPLGTPMDGNSVLTWSGTSFVQNYNDPLAGWGNPSLDLSPGKGFFVNNVSGVPFTNTFVGTVMQGNLTNGNLTVSPFISLVANQVPKAGYLADPAGLALVNASMGGAAGGDAVVMWNGSFVQLYNDPLAGWPTTAPAPIQMDPTGNYGPSIPIGAGFFYYNYSHAAGPWVQNFTVQ